MKNMKIMRTRSSAVSKSRNSSSSRLEQLLPYTLRYYRYFTDDTIPGTLLQKAAALFLGTLAVAAVVVFLLIPQFHDIRSSLAFRIIIRLLFTGGTGCFLLRNLGKGRGLTTVCCVITLFVPWLELFPGTLQITTLLHTALLFLFVVCVLRTDGDDLLCALAGAFYLAVRLCWFGFTKITLIDSTGMHIFAIISAGAAAATAVVLMLRNRCTVINLVCTAVPVFLLSMVLFQNLGKTVNFALDRSEPVTAAETIERLDEFLHVTIDGQPAELRVSAARSALHSVGDEIEIIIREGFFGTGYYMLGEYRPQDDSGISGSETQTASGTDAAVLSSSDAPAVSPADVQPAG